LSWRANRLPVSGIRAGGDNVGRLHGGPSLVALAELEGVLMAGERLAPGDQAPDFTLPDADGNPVALATYRGQRVIVYFYPAAMTPGCTKQACDFTESMPDLAKVGLAVLGISPDSPAKLAKFREKESITFPLLSDPDKSVLTAYGAYGEKMNYGKTIMGVIRSTFVIDAAGTIEKAQYAVKATGHVERLRKELGV
jgi:thioredoxin-dependent peroxiredoxin